MGRSIEQIKSSIISQLQTSFSLSTSAAAEWRLWVNCTAYCIYMFEIILDMFKAEMDADAKKEVAGTLTWYNNKCYEFQLGHELIFDKTTGLLQYTSINNSSQVIKIANVNVENHTLFFRVATKNSENEIIPLTDIQLLNFKNYIDAVKFAGTKSHVISTAADLVRYNITIYYNPTSPLASVKASIINALKEFKTSQKFGGVIYNHKMVETVTGVDGVIAAKLIKLETKGAEDNDYQDIDTLAYLHAGYFNYAEDSILTLISINDI